MTPTKIREKIVVERTSWLRRMLGGLEELPLETEEEFLKDARNKAAAESYLRRALEALLDLGRHVLAKGYGHAATDYQAIAAGLEKHKVLDRASSSKLRTMAGYRNRMVHFYAEINDRELFEIARDGPADIRAVLGCILDWIKKNPDMVDRS